MHKKQRGLEGKSISLAEFFVVSTPGGEIGHGGEGAGAKVFDQAGWPVWDASDKGPWPLEHGVVGHGDEVLDAGPHRAGEPCGAANDVQTPHHPPGSEQGTGDIVPGQIQVRSLTQFNHIGFLQSRIRVKSLVFFTNKQSRFSFHLFSMVFYHLCATHQTSHYLSEAPEASFDAEDPWRALCQLKNPFILRSQTETRELQGGTKENNILPYEGSLQAI